MIGKEKEKEDGEKRREMVLGIYTIVSPSATPLGISINGPKSDIPLLLPGVMCAGLEVGCGVIGADDED